MFKDSSKTSISRVFKDKKKIEPPKISITEDTLLKFKAYVDSCEKEIGWLAFVKRTEDGTYLIYDTILPKQEVTSVTTELTESGLQEIGEEILQTRFDEFENIKCWCHSHVNMQVYPSKTDDDTFEQFYENCEYFIRVICNKKDDMRVDFVDLVNEVRFDNTSWTIWTLPETYEEYVKIEDYDEQIKKIEELKKKAVENIKKIQDDKYKSFKQEIQKEVNAKLIEERPAYKYNYGYNYGKKNYQNPNVAYGTGYEDYDYYESYLNGSENKKVDWYDLSEVEKEENCHKCSVTILTESKEEKGTLVYVEPLKLMSRKEFVKVLEANTVNELKDILKDKKFTKVYDHSDWIALYEELDYFGITEIEEELTREGYANGN